MQVLTFPDDEGPVIRNALIIQLQIERLVLVDQHQRAMELIRAQTGQQVCHSVVLLLVSSFCDMLATADALR